MIGSRRAIARTKHSRCGVPMSADVDYPYVPGGRTSGRHAFEWGLSALFLSGTLTVLFPLCLLVLAAGGVLAMSWPYWDPTNLRLADTVAHIVGFGGIGAAVVALLFALFGCVRGVTQRQPLGTCMGGLLMALAALTLMIMLTVIINTVSHEFYKELPRRQREPAVTGPNGEPLRLNLRSE